MKETYFANLRKLEDIHNSFVASSRAEYLANMKPGQVVPPDDGKIIGEHYQQNFNHEAVKILSDVRSNINVSKRSLKKQMAAAPSINAVRSVQMMDLRSELSQEEVKNMLDAYADDYQACKAIIDIATRKGVVLPECAPAHDKRLLALDKLEQDAMSIFSLTGFEMWTPGKREFVLTNDVNAAYPD